MKKTYYLFNAGRISRKDHTVKFTPIDKDGNELKPKYIPLEGVEEFYVFGALDANSAFYNYMGQQQVALHFFDYYENYTGSFMPREYLLSGKTLVEQVLYYKNVQKRIKIAQAFIEGAATNMLRNLKYYEGRGRKLSSFISEVNEWQTKIPSATDIEMLMGIEGNIRNCYYHAFDEILMYFKMEGRSRQPPKNEVNALVSFGNMLCYTQCLKAIHNSQLHPTISYLHEPGYRRFSLALDLAEIFKPILVDRMIFKLLNKKIIQEKHFDKQVNRVILKEAGKKAFLQEWESRLKETIKHRHLGRSVSYQHLIKLECYKLAKHVLSIETYKPFKAWW